MNLFQFIWNFNFLDSIYVFKLFLYLMMPIWLSSYQYKGKIYRFMVNGQTGNVGGETPISPLRVTIAVLFSLVVIAFLCYFFILE